MSTRILLLLSLVVCMTFAQSLGFGKSQCLCWRVRDRFGAPKHVQDIQIYPPSNSCNQLEIIVSLKNGLQYCLDPRLKKVQDLLINLQNMKNKRTRTPPVNPTTENSPN